jgi:hypothetical protein
MQTTMAKTGVRNGSRTRALAALLGAASLALAGCAEGGSGEGAAGPRGAVAATLPAHHAVVRVDLASRAVTARAHVPVPGFVASSLANGRIYVGSGSSELYALDAGTLAVRGVAEASGIRDVVAGGDGARVFTLAVSSGAATLEARDPVTLEVTAAIGAPAALAARAPFAAGNLLAAAPSGKRLALLAPGVAYIVDGASFASEAVPLPPNFDPSDCAFSADGRTLYAAGADRERKDARLFAIDVARLGVALEVDGGSAEYIAVAPSAGHAYVTGSFFVLTGIGAVDLAARALLAPIPDDRAIFPRDIALSADGAHIVAASPLYDAQGMGRLAIYSAGSLTSVAVVTLEGPSGQVAPLR